MFGLAMLDVAIGLALVFFVFSLALTATNEAFEVVVKSRARYLAKGVRELLDSKDNNTFLESFYGHPLIYPLFRGDFSNGTAKLPSYIPSRNFSLAVLDLVAGPTQGGQPNAPSEKVKRLVDLAIRVGGGDPEKARQEIEAWYDSAMDRVSGWYKRQTQIVVLILALGLTVVGNVNTIAIFQALQVDAKVRDALVDQAVRATTAGAPTDELKRDQMTAALTAAGLPVGWSGAGKADFDRRLGAPGGFGWIEVAVGWLLTALAVSLGAPFWFDVLNRLMVIRATVKPREKSGEEGSEDRQDKGRAKPAAPAAAVGSGANLVSPTAAVAGAAGASTASLVAADMLADAHEDGCLCDEPPDLADQTADHNLPAATGGVALR